MRPALGDIAAVLLLGGALVGANRALTSTQAVAQPLTKEEEAKQKLLKEQQQKKQQQQPQRRPDGPGQPGPGQPGPRAAPGAIPGALTVSAVELTGTTGTCVVPNDS